MSKLEFPTSDPKLRGIWIMLSGTVLVMIGMSASQFSLIFIGAIIIGIIMGSILVTMFPNFFREEIKN